MSPCLFQDVWRAPCININTKFQYDPIINHTNSNDHIMGPKISGHTMRAKNLSSHLKINIYMKYVRKNSLLCESTLPHHYGSFKHVSNGIIKRKVRHQKSSDPFN